ncbi:mRNA export factor GLE1 [Candida tropicalis]
MVRYGLPDNYDLLVDPIPEPVTLSLIKAQPEPSPRPSTNKAFEDAYQNIETCISAFVELTVKEQDSRNEILNSKIGKHDALANANISHLADDFNTRLELQTKQVRDEEEERKRIEEEKKRKEQEERERKAEEERKRKQAEEEAKKKQELKEKLEKEESEKKKKERLSSLATTNPAKIEESFLKYKQDILDIKNNIVLKLNANKELKKLVNQHKRKINPKFGQLSNSISQLRKVGTEVLELIKPTKADELVFKWILNFVAKAIIDQAETEVIVRPNSALPLAHLAFTILHTFPEFEYFLNARFIKKCPYIIGYTCSIDSEEGRKRMGWKRTSDNKWEDEVKYDERMGGIVSVWSVMTRLTDYNLQLPLYNIGSSWTFLARIANLDQQLLSNTHFAILGNWWEACAAQFANAYGGQSKKLLFVVVTQLTDVVANKKFPSAARLRILGEDWQQRGRMESLKEMEP